MTTPKLRDYQSTAIDKIYGYWANDGGSPLIEMATGLGKSVVIAQFVRDLLVRYPEMRVLILVHVAELVMQDLKAILQVWPGAPIGVYSAGLGRRDRFRQITIGSIQSLYRQDANSIGPIDLVIVDEAHLIPHRGDGMYRKLLESLRDARPDLRVLGLTATPFRTDSGRLDEGEGSLFDETIYAYGIGPAVDDGWLAPLVSKPGAAMIDTSGVKKTAGEFNAAQLEAVSNRDEITQAAIRQLLDYGSDRRSWLIFCAGIDHANDFAAALQAVGISAAAVTSQTDKYERGRLITDHKAGRIRALTGMNVMTTGYDNPLVDLLVLLRATLAPGLLIQMMGRGTRTIWPNGFDPNEATAHERCDAIASSPKPSCLVLDFAGNIRRHGPIDLIDVPSKGASKGGGKSGEDEVRAKVCPECLSYVGVATRTCQYCGHDWPYEDKPTHEREADIDTPILARVPALAAIDEVPVTYWDRNRHTKFESPDSLCVTYYAGLMAYREWWAFEHQGFARAKAEKFWRMHGGQDPAPVTVQHAMGRWDELTPPAVIQVRKNGKFFDIMGRKFAPRQEEVA